MPTIPEHLSDIISTTPYDRLVHNYGKSYADMARMLMRQVHNPPDAVAFPKTEDDIQQLFSHAAANNFALIPFGAAPASVSAGGHLPDPQGILNPGALFDPQDKNVGIRGVLGG